jgi:hypothetical protein
LDKINASELQQNKSIADRYQARLTPISKIKPKSEILELHHQG